MRIPLISIILILYSTNIANCSIFKTNYDIMDSLAKSVSIEAIDYSSCSAGDTIRLNNNQHSASWLIDQYLISESMKRGIAVYDSAKVFIGLTVNITEARTKYSNLPDDDMKILREVNINVNFILRDKSGKLSQKENVFRYYKDTLALEDIPKAGDSPYDFARAEIPTEQASFWQKALEPAVLIVSGAIIVYLLFTVRSK